MIKKLLSMIAGDMAYSVGALVCFNGVIQLVIYPYLSKSMGEDAFGIVLVYLSLISIMGTSFGSGANLSRMVVSMKRTDINGDYNVFLLFVCILSIIVSVVACLYIGTGNAWFVALLSVLMILSVLRYYGEVNYRQSVNFKGYFVYYILISAGYIIGIVLYRITKSWVLVFLLGEALAVLYVALRGFIFKRPWFKITDDFNSNIKSMTVMSFSNLIIAFVLNSDRLFLYNYVGAAEVTVFYTASLIGKTIALITVPLNGVLIGYLARYKGRFTSKMFTGFILGFLALGVIATVGSTAVSYLFVRILYPDIFDMAKQYFLIANAGQIFYFVSNTLMIVVLRFAKEKYQLYINIIYAVIFAAAVIPGVKFFGLWGMTISLLAVNLIKYIIVSLTGLIRLRHGDEVLVSEKQISI